MSGRREGLIENDLNCLCLLHWVDFVQCRRAFWQRLIRFLPPDSHEILSPWSGTWKNASEDSGSQTLWLIWFSSESVHLFIIYSCAFTVTHVHLLECQAGIGGFIQLSNQLYHYIYQRLSPCGCCWNDRDSIRPALLECVYLKTCPLSPSRHVLTKTVRQYRQWCLHLHSHRPAIDNGRTPITR